ncbi:polyamine-transporting ATPase 13A3 [Anabrus simplex]|uniref:polyamine-transporting ATPase 13A3 n=1 Tax=Anabrus simplex TaxID=316456 RepID=UPI0035A36CDB
MPQSNGVLKGGAVNGANGISPKSEMDYINYGEDDEMKVFGYRWSPIRAAGTWLCIIFTAGFLRLVFHWCPQWMLYCMYTRCSLGVAERVLLEENFQGRYTIYHIKDVKTISIKDASPDGNRQRVDRKDLVRIYLSSGAHRDVDEIRAIWVKKLCYIWDERTFAFYKLCGLDNGVTRDEFHRFKGYTEQQQRFRRVIYGYNQIPVPLQSILTLLILEVINPFYIFQAFTLVVWLCEKYYYYMGAIVLMSVFGVTSSIIQTRRNQRSLHNTVTSMGIVTVCRGEDKFEDIPTNDLVPGDVFIIPSHGCAMECDAILLNGSCIVNESMLTGESVPVTKTAMPRGTNTIYSEKEDGNHTLFCGTKVIQTRYYGNEPVKAVVMRTGFLTAKGNLVRSILYPPPADFKFDQDTYKFIFILAIIAALGVLYTVIYKVLRHLPASSVAIKALDIITIVIPPALPATMTMGKLYGQQRLQAAKIYCINSRVINVSGSLDCVCFDKTGTLTEDGLDMWGVVPAEDCQFLPPVKQREDLKMGPLMEGMACCHSMTLIENELSGDPLDVKMFEFTGWQLEEPNVAENSKFDMLVPTVVKQPSSTHSQVAQEIGIIHQYQFSSTLQRMSVITRTLGAQNFVAFCKGSPEMIVSLSKPETVPADLVSTLHQYTVSGYRVIAMGYRVLEETSYHKVLRLMRDDVEKDLTFVGLIILENRLKPQTTGIIRQLKLANVRTIMITGDNIQTAVSVARECGIVEAEQRVVDVTAVDDGPPKVYFTESAMISSPAPTDCKLGVMNNGFVPEEGDAELGGQSNTDYRFALTGRTWGVIRDELPELLPKIITRGAVFARMSSDQKQQLVLDLKELGYYVAMCGDGANDCGALKAAHAGISLSEAEASVASPFTSREANISCVPKVIREGRAALVTAFGIFKFMVAYSLTEFLSTAILYYIDSNLTDFQFLFIDICLVVHFALFFGNTHAYSGQLVKETPTTSLYSLPPMASLVLQMIIVIVFQVISIILVQTFPWFTPYEYEFEKYTSYENYAVYTVSMFQYIIMAIVFSHGAPYRKSIFSNRWFVVSLVAMTAICVYITVYPAEWVATILELKVPPVYNFRIIVLCLALANFLIALFIERFVIEYLLFQKMRDRFDSEDRSRRKYLKIEEELMMDYNWPPISKELPLIPSKSTEQLVPRPIDQVPNVVVRSSLPKGIKSEINMTTSFNDTF